MKNPCRNRRLLLNTRLYSLALRFVGSRNIGLLRDGVQQSAKSM